MSVRRFTPPTRKAFDKAGQTVIDDVYRVLNEISVGAGESRGAPATIPQTLVFSGIEQARTFFQELNIQTLHAVATRTGSLTIDNVLTMSEGARIYNLDSYNITDEGIFLEANASLSGKDDVNPLTSLRFIADITNSASAVAGYIASYWQGIAITSNAVMDITVGQSGSVYNGTLNVYANTTQFISETDLGNPVLYGTIIAGAIQGGTNSPINLPYGVYGLTIDGGLQLKYRQITTGYTVTIEEDCIIDCTSGTFTVTLYAAFGNAGRTLTIINSGSGTITVDANASETINGNLTQTLSTEDAMTIICTGTGWRII